MKKIMALALMVIWGSISAQATLYVDSTNDLVDATMNIETVEVTNNSEDLNFTITLVDEGFALNDSIRFGVGIDSTTNGSTTADAWNDKIIMSSGMDFWCGGWTTAGTNAAGMNVYDATLGGWPEWENGGDGSTWVEYRDPIITNGTISFSVSLATLGLSAGDSFNFDVYTFWNDGFPSDAVALDTTIPWEQYDSGSNVVSYTVISTTAVPAEASIDVDGSNVTIGFLAHSNASYYVQSVPNLTDIWENASDLIIGDGTTNLTVYSADTNATFYRVVQP